jgi:hypothetical protein
MKLSTTSIWISANLNVSRLIFTHILKLFSNFCFTILGCCIYKKPHVFGESSSESEDDDCENCFGHVELKKGNPPPPPPSVPPVSWVLLIEIYQ